MRIISIATQKGGAGKTTTARELCAAAVKAGQRALMIDLDPQCNLSLMCGTPCIGKASYDLLAGVPGAEVVKQTGCGDIIPGSTRLSSLDAECAGKKGSNTLLRKALKQFEGMYDVIFIDCPPSLGLPLINALTASTDVLIPMQADALHLQGLGQLYSTIKAVQDANNPDLHPLGAFFTRYNGRSVLSREYGEMIRMKCDKLQLPFINAPIRESITIREAQSSCKSLLEYAPKSKQAADYKALYDAINE